MIVFTSTLEAARHNIRAYQTEVRNHPTLRARASYVRAWYVDKDDAGNWIFAPSKFVGYSDSSAKSYLEASGDGGARDGRETERLLATWFNEIDRSDPLGAELFNELRSFLGKLGQLPNKLARINILGEHRPVERDGAKLRLSDRDTLLARVVTDPEICGGRPIIRGTRMRVVDIVEMLAAGASRREILDDFDYLVDDDITAALLHLAKAADYRTIRAA